MEMTLPGGYYWARDRDDIRMDGARFVVLRQGGVWYTIGEREPIDLDAEQILCPVKQTQD